MRKDIVPAETIAHEEEVLLNALVERNRLERKLKEANKTVAFLKRRQEKFEKDMNLWTTGVSAFAAIAVAGACLLHSDWWSALAGVLLVWICGRKGGWW